MDQASRGGRPRVRDARAEWRPGLMMMRQVYYECVLNGVCKSGMDGASRLYYGGARTRDDSQYFERSRESAPVRLIVCSMSGGEREELCLAYC